MANPIPYGHQLIDDTDIDAVVSVLKSDYLTTGPKVAEFERTISRYIGCPHTIAVNSGTSALDIAVQVLDLPKGSEVISTAFTFAATNNALLYNDLVPVFADIEKETRNIDPNSIKKKISKKTKAILTVDYAGHPSQIDEIREIADTHNLRVIEDACHAFGASCKGRKTGSFGADMTVFSFHPVKPITTGEGGAVVTGDPEYAQKMSLLRTHGISREAEARMQFGMDAEWAYDMVELGRNYRLTDLQAALGISQMKKIDLFIQKRNALAKHYGELLEDIPFIELPVIRPGIISGWHLYTVLLNHIDRNRFFSFMRSKGIGVNLHYIPTYRFSYYRKKMPVDPRDYPVTEDIFNRIITIPLHPGMTDEQVSYVAECIKMAGKTLYE